MAQIKKETAIRTIDGFGANLVVYTDGSREGGTEEGGAAVVITSGPAANPRNIQTLQIRGG